MVRSRSRGRFTFRPAFEGRRDALKGYIADVSALVFGCGLTRRQARRLAFRLLDRQGMCPLPTELGLLAEDLRRELLQLADGFAVGQY